MTNGNYLTILICQTSHSKYDQDFTACLKGIKHLSSCKIMPEVFENVKNILLDVI